MLILIYVVKTVRQIIDSLVVFKSLMFFFFNTCSLTAMVNFKYKGSIKLNTGQVVSSEYAQICFSVFFLHNLFHRRQRCLLC